jgi:glutathione S-transferase
MVAENEIARGPNDARLHDKFGFPIDVDKARQIAARILGLLDARLSQNDWLAGDHVTIAERHLARCLPRDLRMDWPHPCAARLHRHAGTSR